MNNIMKIILVILMAVYVVSPVDLAVGPIDDVIVVLVALIASRRKQIK